MKFSTEQLNRLRTIMEKDYGVLMNDSQLEKFASSIVRLANVSLKALTEENDTESLPSVRANVSSIANTST
ncbi:MAG: hypothetical protein NDI62_03100 [Burkholderiales bacterium]|nr:hypothetical protein [Burkholderiales bacterium]